MHPYIQYVNPHLGKLLKDLKMDKQFIRGEGCYLYDNQGNQYLDCVASYGALPFGSNPKEIWDCIHNFYQTKEPNFIQPSALNAAGELAKKLIEITHEKLQYVTFTNSGAESVEVAIKLCRSSTSRIGILSTKNSFHGKTLGALSATGKNSYQQAFGAPINGFNYVKYGDLDSLEHELENNPAYYAAFIIEPIQGEGGIVEPPKNYLKKAKELCSKYRVLFILDEIQTGLGRTGTLFAYEEENVYPDVILLAKALGGGIVPIGACISTAEVYNEEFAIQHSSTFAGNSFACRVGLKVLEILTRNNQEITETIKKNGKILKNNLLTLKDRYPKIIKSIRGRGLMLGIEFGIDRNTFPGSFLGIMAEQDLLTPVVSSYLLNNEKLRVAPTLNGNHVIRIEPPLNITENQCLAAIQGIEKMLEVLNEGNTAKFLSYLIDTDSNKQYNKFVHKHESRVFSSGSDDEGRFAFLIHPVDLKNYCEFDESLYIFNENELHQLTSSWTNMVEPFAVSQTKIISASGKEAFGEFIAIPKTAEQLINMPKDQVLNELKTAINLGKKRGAKIIGLGAYTSVVSMGGLYLKDSDVPLTTGNSYTVVSAADAILYSMEKLEILPEYATAGIVGATGSIGKGITKLISQSVSRLILIGNPKNKQSSLKRLYNIAGEIYKYLATLINEDFEFTPGSIGYKLLKMNNLPNWDAHQKEFVEFSKSFEMKDSPIIVTTSINEMLPLADVIISATNNIDKLITPGNLKYGAIICDMSRPGNVSEEVQQLRPDVLVIDGGVIEVPGLPSLGWNFGFEKGLAYACMAETMMLALEHHYTHTSIGSSGVSLDSILFTRDLAKKHGFKLANLRSFDRPLSNERWETVLNTRSQKIG
ncbi:MAG: aminotransferase class III-fold pyridoxal phosphate-dependent enzyme [Halanaerobiales bacterium]|nr:aminotransferase class III-fold pyridoxal phosphate-dependent enzyme [Halanaerobiales bacterium]